MNDLPILHAMWGIVYRDSTTYINNFLMFPSPEDSYIKWRPFTSTPFVVKVYNTPGALHLFSSKQEAAAYIRDEGLDALQNAPYPITIYIAKEDTQ